MQSKFVQIKTKDGLTLPGLFYEVKKSKKAVIYLHGNGSSSIFYNEKSNRIYAQAYVQKGISALYFNNRGAHIIKTFRIKTKKGEVRKPYGMAYEKIKDCINDIEGAIRFLKQLGYEDIYLVGNSTGANKICVYDHYRPINPLKKYVILAGGDDVAIYYRLLGKKKFLRLLDQAKKKIKIGKGEKIMPELLEHDLIFSYQGFYDIANPDGDYNIFPYLETFKNLKLSRKPLFRYFKAIKKKSIIIYGEYNDFGGSDAEGAVGLLKSYQPDMDYKIIKSADHHFAGYQKRVAKIIAEWLAR